MNKFLLVLLVAMVGATSVVAQETADIKMDYSTFSPVDPNLAPYWQDYIKGIPADGTTPATILAYSMPTSNGGSITVSYFTGSGVCGLQKCTVRIVEDGNIIDSFDVCRVPEDHYLSADGHQFKACGEVRQVGGNPIPLPK